MPKHAPVTPGAPLTCDKLRATVAKHLEPWREAQTARMSPGLTAPGMALQVNPHHTAPRAGTARVAQ
jgi:hypothetical protein